MRKFALYVLNCLFICVCIVLYSRAMFEVLGFVYDASSLCVIYC